MKKIVAYIFSLAFFMPLVGHAQRPNPIYITTWIDQLIYWLRLSITVLMIFMTVYFLWSVYKFMQADPAAKTGEKKKMINGLIGLFVAVGVWGIIRIAGSVLGIDTKTDSLTNQPIGVTCPPGLRYVQATGTCER